jgi:hypothetical protein
MGAYGNTSEATPRSSDSDADELPDDREVCFFGSLDSGPNDDRDADGKSNLMEYRRGANPVQSLTRYANASVPTSGDGTSWQTAFKTIQEAIRAALEWDTVIAAQGTYQENINFCGKNFILRSTNPHDPSVVANTIIDGGKKGSVVTFQGSEDETCLLSGFTIRNGEAEEGGGIAGNGTHATIENNVITGNRAYTYAPCPGGGLASCHGMIRNNVISENSAARGGGLCWCNGTISGNVIKGNLAYPGLDYFGDSDAWSFVDGEGGGLFDCNGTIRDNSIVENSALKGGGLFGCGGTIQANQIAGNRAYAEESGEPHWARADGCGGGLYSCSGVVQNNTITGNSAEGPGGGIAESIGTIRNNTIADNSATTNGDGFYKCRGTILNCIVWGNTAKMGPQLCESCSPMYSCIQNWTVGGEGNTAAPPLFVDPNGPDNSLATYSDNNYRLLSDSPCIDEGGNEDWMLTTLDLDGNRRIFHGRTSLTVDMGAYEYGSSPFQILEVKKSAEGEPQIIWSSHPDDTCVVWSCSDLLDNEWVEEASIASQGTSTAWTDPDTSPARKFYRIELK